MDRVPFGADSDRCCWRKPKGVAGSWLAGCLASIRRPDDSAQSSDPEIQQFSKQRDRLCPALAPTVCREARFRLKRIVIWSVLSVTNLVCFSSSSSIATRTGG